MKIDLIAGARPNFVKLASLIHVLERKQEENTFRLIHTGQHYDDSLSGSFFRQLQLPKPHVDLQIGSGSQAEQTAAIMLRYEKILDSDKPDICIVVGDVTSSMACAITAKKMNVKVAHVEAGIRSGDLAMPEEVNRILIDSISDIFFTTTRNASANLLKAGIPQEKIFFVGNTMIDTLLRFRPCFKKPEIADRLKLKKKEYLVLTLHRPSNVDEKKQLANLLKEISEHSKGLPVIFPVHPRTAAVLQDMEIKNSGNLHIIPPLSYLEFNYLVEQSLAVITDSGGITEETTVMGIPCLTLRDTTERPETITIGTNELLGTHSAAVGTALEKVFANQWRKGAVPELWDGRTGERIVEHLSSIKFKNQENF